MNIGTVNLFEFEDWLFGENKAVYRLAAHNLSDAAGEYRDQIEAYILADMKEQIEWGQISGVLNGETLVYRRNLNKNKKASSAAAGIGTTGFVLGLVFGWLLFDNMVLGVVWGICFSSLGGVLASGTASRKEWASFDFANRKYVESTEES
jgi:hypothetical protein